MDVDVKVGTTDETAVKYNAKKKDESMTIDVHPSKHFFFLQKLPATFCSIVKSLLDINLKMYEIALTSVLSQFLTLWLCG